MSTIVLNDWNLVSKNILYVVKQVQKFLSKNFMLPEKKVILSGYQEFFSKYFFTLDKYRQFLEKVNPPFLIYNMSEFTINRGTLNHQWNTTGFEQVDLQKYTLYIQKTFVRIPINITLYTDSRPQLLYYVSLFLATFDVPQSKIVVRYPIEIPDDEPIKEVINEEVFTVLSPDNITDQSEYIFDDNMRTFKLTTSFTLEGYILTRIRYYNKITQVNLQFSNTSQTIPVQEQTLYNDISQNGIVISINTNNTTIPLLTSEIIQQTDLTNPTVETNSIEVTITDPTNNTSTTVPIISSNETNTTTVVNQSITVNKDTIPFTTVNNSIITPILENSTNTIKSTIYTHIKQTIYDQTINNKINLPQNIINLINNNVITIENVQTQIQEQIGNQLTQTFSTNLQTSLTGTITTQYNNVISTVLNQILGPNNTIPVQLQITYNEDTQQLSVSIQNINDIQQTINNIVTGTTENIFNNITNTTIINDTISNSLTQTMTQSQSTFTVTVMNPNNNTILADNSQITISNEVTQTLNNVLVNQVSGVYSNTIMNNYNKFIQGTQQSSTPIIPLSKLENVNLNYNINVNYRISETTSIYTVPQTPEDYNNNEWVVISLKF